MMKDPTDALLKQKREPDMSDILEYLLSKEVMQTDATMIVIQDKDLMKVLKGMEDEFSQLGVQTVFETTPYSISSRLVEDALQDLRASGPFISEWKYGQGYSSGLNRAYAEHRLPELESRFTPKTLQILARMSEKMHAALEGSIKKEPPIIRAVVNLRR